MNNKGFAVTTMVYAAVILLATIMFSVLAIERSEYGNQRDLIDKVNNELNQCMESGEC